MQKCVKKYQEQYEKTIELKGRVGKFPESSLTFCAKAVLQSKNKQKADCCTWT